jgi:hypothetical protein
MGCALVRGSARGVKRGWQGQKPLIFMHFHGVSFGSQHEIWSKQHNGKVRKFHSISPKDTRKTLKRIFGSKNLAFCVYNTIQQKDASTIHQR